MTTEICNIITLIIQYMGIFCQSFIWIVMTGTFIIYWRQLIEMRKGVKSQNLLEIIKFLQEPQNRDARTHVINELKDRDYTNWTETDKEYAGLVCSSYDTAGGLLKKGIADSDLIFEGYKDSIEKCHRILTPYVEEKRKETSPSYWINYEWFFDHAIECKSPNKL